METKQRRVRYCAQCGHRLARDNSGRSCAGCQGKAHTVSEALDGAATEVPRPLTDGSHGVPPQPKSADDDAMTLFAKTLGDLLASFRGSMELSQQQLADRISYSRATVAGAEAASRIPSESFWKCCDDALATDGRLCHAYRQLADARAAKTQELLRQVDMERQARIDAQRASLGLPPLIRQSFEPNRPDTRRIMRNPRSRQPGAHVRRE